MLSSKVKAHFQKVVENLQIEKAQDLKEYERKTALSSYKHRRKLGVCWYPVLLEKSSYDSGDRLIARVSRSKEHIQNDAFQSGKPVSLFCVNKSTGEEIHQLDAIVLNAKEQEMFISLKSDDLPLWIHDGILGVQLQFDDHSYKEMEWALRHLVHNEDPQLQRTIEVIIGDAEPEFSDTDVEAIPVLNKSQNAALSNAMASNDIALIHGPPGTGKTTTVVQLVKEIAKREAQILVCAPSNAAVDLLVERLSDQDIDCLRIGHPARVDEYALSKTVDYKLSHHSEYPILKRMRKQADEYFSLAGKWKRNFGKEERNQRKLLLEQARKLKSECEDLEHNLMRAIVEGSHVIACTLVGANNRKIKGLSFDTVIIDEAAQALEPASWIPILKGKRVIMAGDHKQLPPTVKSYEAKQKGLDITLFDHIAKNKSVDKLLETQYRMADEIMGFANNEFYGGKLKTGIEQPSLDFIIKEKRIEFVDTAGTGFEEYFNPESQSTSNRDEANVLFQHLISFTQELPDDTQASLAIISPYRGQVEILSELNAAHAEELSVYKHIKVNTIDGFQGQERDVVYLSLCRSNENGELGFLTDYRRLNVALTRAKSKLVIVGDSATLGSNKFYENLLEYVSQNGSYRSAFEFNL